MTHEQNFDARKFASICLSDAVDAIDTAHAYLRVTDTSDESFARSSSHASDPTVQENEIREMAYGFIGHEIYVGIFENPDVQESESLKDDQATTRLVISRLNALIERYDPQYPHWKAADYVNYDAFWTNFNDDFGWPGHLAEKIVALDDPNFVSGVFSQLRDIANSPREE